MQAGAADVLGHVNVRWLYSYLSESFGAWEQRPTSAKHRPATRHPTCRRSFAGGPCASHEWSQPPDSITPSILLTNRPE